MKEIDPFEAFVLPTKEFTKNSRYKIVRALGSVACIPMFPWTVVAILGIVISAVIFNVSKNLRDIAVTGVNEFHDWWENV